VDRWNVSRTMIDQILSILAFVSLAMAAFGLGRPILRGLSVAEEDRLSLVVWSISLGLIAAGLVLLVLGLLGILYAPLIGLITAAACLMAVGEIGRGYIERKISAVEDTRPRQFQKGPQTSWTPPAPWLSGGLLLAAGAACLGSLLAALAPPTAGDAMCYHLELPKTFLLQHRIVYLPYHDNSTFPLLAEIWYLWALAVEGGVCAQLVHWGLGILLGLATVVLATPVLGRPWAWIAGGLVVLTPGVNNQMTAPLNDVALAAMTTLAVAAWWRAVVAEDGRRWFLLAGLAAGAALGTKYIALLLAVAVGLAWLWIALRNKARRRLLLEGAAIVAVVAASVGGIWYVRAAWHRGNPVYPFLGEVFSDRQTANSDLSETLPKSKSPLGRGPIALASAPWQVTMHPERFGGRGHQLGVLPLVALPGLLFCRRLRGLGTLLAVSAGYAVLWFLLRQNVRFLFPVVPLLAAATVWVWVGVRRFPIPARWTVAAAFAGVVAAMAAVGLHRAGDRLAVATGIESREDYLLRHEPTYQAAAVLNRLAPEGAHVLSQDYRGFYFDSRVTRENVYRRHSGYDRCITDPARLSHQLRRAGFTHLLLAEASGSNAVGFDPTLSRLADAQTKTASADALLTLTEYRFRDCHGAVRRYRLVMLR